MIIYKNLIILLQSLKNTETFDILSLLRFSDFSVIRSEDVRDGLLYKKQGKTKHWVVVPLKDEAKLYFHKIILKELFRQLVTLTLTTI